MLAAGVAGLAVGGIAGAVIVHEMSMITFPITTSISSLLVPFRLYFTAAEDDNPETTVIVVQSDEAVVVEQEPEPEPEPEESGSSSEDEEEEAEEDD